ncbi:MAG: DMT family transporter [Clostridiaceae bacterium]|jgi:drug/metabolite transporter (DMT)-like permease|nr:DMT family transporter [Clostridiaceae bacterium]
MKHRTTGAVIISLLTCVIWGFSFLFTRSIVIRIHFLSLLSWRFLIATLAFLLLIRLKVFKVNLKGKKLRPLIYISIAEPLIFFTCESIGLYLTSTTESSLMIATIPIVTMLIGIPIAGEMPTKKQAVAIILSVVGVMVIILGQSRRLDFNILGYIVLLIAVISGSVFAALSAKYKEYTSVEKSFAMIVIGLIGFGSAALIRNLVRGTVKEWLLLPVQDREFLIAILYLGLLASIICYVGQQYSLSVIGLNRNTSFSGVITLTSVLAGVFILDEKLSLSMLIGGIIVVLGVYGVNFYTPQREHDKAICPQDK